VAVATVSGTALVESDTRPAYIVHAMDIHVLKGAGLGLNERALQTVHNWHFKPAPGPEWQACGDGH
jgi:hypothetical protein